MTSPPAYFETIRQQAARRWEQLESDPELAAPWRQLFKQVQSPRHVLSELLQNADDAGASETSVSIEDGAFVFTHNGEDFIEEHFASLCKFGYSNKRALHTIGFRGIGFKSTFSLGDKVELRTPTLSVQFGRKRFTEPAWNGVPVSKAGLTCVRVLIADAHREKEIRKNLEEWIESPVSLLFFKSIRRMRIGDREVRWESLGRGPVEDTEWMALNGDADKAFLIARSGFEDFPDEALAEIHDERMLAESEGNFPPCQVELVLGANGRLYVVLPTGVETEVPFACNAPFVQDPARLKIKDPEISPTNRWLLGRIGELAAYVMMRWLEQGSSSVQERARAYGFVPDVDRDDKSLEGLCGTSIELAFGEAIEDKAVLLTNDGELRKNKEAVIVPDELLNVWPAERVAVLFGQGNQVPLAPFVANEDRQKLAHWGLVEEISRNHVLSVIQTQHLPRPESWRQLLLFWAYLSADVTGYRYGVNKSQFRIVPVQGKDVLHAPSECVRLGEKRLLQSEKDWSFLASHLLVLNPNWPRHLAEQRREAEARRVKGGDDEVFKAIAVLEALGLSDASDANKVVEQVAKDFFAQDSIEIEDCVQFAQIAATLGVTVGESFRFVSRDCHLRSINHSVLTDRDKTLDTLLPELWCDAHLLHETYWTKFSSCTSEDWERWISSGRSGLVGFIQPVQKSASLWGRKKLELELRRRGFAGAPYYPYKTEQFQMEDWDFEKVHWDHWASLAKDDPNLWSEIGERIVQQPEGAWTKSRGLRVVQVATTGSTQRVTNESILPTWILRLRELPCLPDTRGACHQPMDLMMRTAETESLMDVEPFIRANLDREAAKPLLRLLGVRDKPSSPERLLARLEIFAGRESFPVHEVEKWYRRLDQMADACSTGDLASIKTAFREKNLVLTESGRWVNSSEAFIASDEGDVPGAEVVRTSVQDLSLWRKVGIADRPTIELAIQWLKQMPSGAALASTDARRVRGLLTRYPDRIWNECSHWINLAGEWASVSTLSYSLTMQSLVSWKHLHEWVKQKTADFQPLAVTITESVPFSELPRLATCIEERFSQSPVALGAGSNRPWLNTLGRELQRVVLSDQADTERVRKLARDLAKTTWQVSPGLEIVPHIEGVPAGTPRNTNAVWIERILYVEKRSVAKLAQAVADELNRAFQIVQIADAIKLCFDRTADFVSEYVEENFTLVPSAELDLEEETPKQAPASDSTSAETPASPEKESAPSQQAGQGDNDGQTISKDAVVEGDIEAEDEAIPPREPAKQRVINDVKPPKWSIMERFARLQGFHKDGGERYYHEDGSWLTKPDGERFWERRTSTGELLRRYWPKDHCLQQEPLQIEAEIWGLLDRFEAMYALVLSDPEGNPIEMTGSRLRGLRDDGQLKFYPATYRMVYENDNKS